MPPKQKADTAGYQQLKKDLAGGEPGRLYLFHGEETYLRDHYLGRLKELLHRGELLGGEEALTKHVLQEETRKIQIRLVEGLPTSFLTSRGWLGSVE